MQNNAKNKTQKKIDNQLRTALAAVCEQALKDVAGFRWLTHQADYANFPASLLITCVFETEVELVQAKQQNLTVSMQKRIQASLLKIGIRFKNLDRQVVFDTEEICKSEDNHNWQQRLVKQQGRAVPHNKRP